VFRKMSFLLPLALLLIPATPAFAQDQPSLGDVARQARKDKEKNATKPKDGNHRRYSPIEQRLERTSCR
jgi:hypothetical protein